MQVTFIGTGGAFSRRFGQSNALVESGDVRLMIDLGFQSPARLETYGRSLAELTHVAVSHVHADHVGGLEELAFASRFKHKRTPTLVLPADIGEELWEHSLRGGLEWVADDKGRARRCDLASYFKLMLMEGEEWVDLEALKLRAFATDHVPGKSSWGFIVRDVATGDQAIFGCDTRVLHKELLLDPLPEDFERGPIFHDCLLTDEGASAIHVLLRDIEYPPAVQERIVVTHYGDDLEDHLPAIRRAGLQLARAGETITFPNWRDALDLDEAEAVAAHRAGEG